MDGLLRITIIITDCLIRLMNKDERFIQLAESISGWSKDPSTKVGAICVNDKDSIVATGYNGFPRGFNDYQFRLDNRELKYKYTIHAEANVLYNALYNGVCVNGCTLYIFGLPPCSSCALAIVQSGIKRVVFKKVSDRWDESYKLSKEIFDEVGIKCEEIQ